MKVSVKTLVIVIVFLRILGIIYGHDDPFKDTDHDGVPDKYDTAPNDPNVYTLNSQFWNEYKADNAFGSKNQEGTIVYEIYYGNYSSYDCADVAILMFKKFCERRNIDPSVLALKDTSGKEWTLDNDEQWKAHLDTWALMNDGDKQNVSVLVSDRQPPGDTSVIFNDSRVKVGAIILIKAPSGYHNHTMTIIQKPAIGGLTVFFGTMSGPRYQKAFANSTELNYYITHELYEGNNNWTLNRCGYFINPTKSQ